MNKMIKFTKKHLNIKAPAKINLHLEIIKKRNDGFHELAMIMQSIDLADFIDIRVNMNGLLHLSTDCRDLDVNENNLIIRAAKLLKNFAKNKDLGADIFLNKNIPIGAGLAGGSSDAAATLIGLNKLWELNIDSKTIHKLALEIGSDVPFCIDGGSQFSFGKGELLEECILNCELAVILIKNPNESISTSDVYRKYSNKFLDFSNSKDVSLEERRNSLRNSGFPNINIFNKKLDIKNDLQKIVNEENKSVKDALNIFSQLEDVLGYSMSGSGPSCYALFENIDIANKIYKNNIELFKKSGFDSWVCKFLNHGIKVN